MGGARPGQRWSDQKPDHAGRDSVGFIDYYEILEISPNANSDTIERVFRYLAQRYHPDNKATGDRARFDLVLEAHDTLRDTVRRVQYDLEYKRHSDGRSELVDAAGDSESIDRDVAFQTKLLSLFYAKRRRNVSDPGIGDAELAALLDCPAEYLDFHLWYLKEKRWISRKEDGLLAITIEGVDRASSGQHAKAAEKLLTDQTSPLRWSQRRA
jgi:curved DNA-binding protein CbpA